MGLENESSSTWAEVDCGEVDEVTRLGDSEVRGWKELERFWNWEPAA